MEIECPICLENINTDDICKTICDHEYCYDCLHHWLKISDNCTSCRESIKTFKYKNETNRILYVNDIESVENVQRDMNSLRRTLDYALRRNEYHKRLYLLIKIISGLLSLTIAGGTYLLIECEHKNI